MEIERLPRPTETWSQFRGQSYRLETFTSAIEEFADRQSYTPALRFAVAGFIFVRGRRGTESYIKCPWCNLALRRIHPSQSPLLWHKILTKNRCIFIVRNNYCDKQDIVKLTITPRQSTISDRRIPQDEANLTLHNNDPLVTDSGANNGPDNLADVNFSVGMPNSELKAIYKRYSSSLLHLVSDESLPAILRPGRSGLELPSQNFERQRLSSFANWPKEDIVAARKLAAVGFQYTGSGDEVQCVFCKVKISDWTAEMDPLKTHIHKHPPCPLVQGSLLATNIPDTLTDLAMPTTSAQNMSQALGIITDSSAHPGFAVPTRREDSFLTWPVENKKLAAEMVECMLFYSGNKDECVCFSCGIKMSKWSETENVWIRHARMSPHCQLLLREKGQEFVDNAIEEHGAFQQRGREAVINVVTTRMIRPRMDSNVAQAVFALYPKYSRDEVKNALIDNIKYGGQDFLFTEPLIASILNSRDEARRLNSVRREAEQSIDPPEIVQLPQLDDVEQVETDGVTEGAAGPAVPGNGINQVEPAPVDPVPAGGDDPMAPVAPVEPEQGEEERGARYQENPIEFAQRMKSQLSCKICLDQLVGIIFLPCGHAACCVSCAPAMVTCPLCRHDVNGTIRIHFDKL